MDADTSLVTGMMLVILSVPALISAWADKRLPVIGTLLLFGGCALGVYAYRETDGGYTLDQIPDVVYGVIGQIF